MKQTESTIDFASLDFSQTMRAFELAYENGKDYGLQLFNFATAVTYSVFKKLIDPQRKDAEKRHSVSKAGCSPVLIALRSGLGADTHLLENTRTANDKATTSHLNANGEMVWNETADADAVKALEELLSERLSDGIDVVQEVATAILEQAKAQATHFSGWMECPYLVYRVNRKVLIKDDTVAYVWEIVTPIQEVYRVARRYIKRNETVKTDPKNGYLYIEDYAKEVVDENGNYEIVYRRLTNHADLGGNDSNGNYTTDIQTAVDYYTMLERLQLTEKQTRIVMKAMSGMGKESIAQSLGVSYGNIQTVMGRIENKCRNLGYLPNELVASKVLKERADKKNLDTAKGKAFDIIRAYWRENTPTTEQREQWKADEEFVRNAKTTANIKVFMEKYRK